MSLRRRCRRAGLRRGRRRGCGGELDRVAALQSFGRAVDHPIRRGEAGGHLDAVAEIPAELDGFEHYFVAVAKQRDLHTMVARDQRRCRYAYHVRVARDLEMDLAIGTWRELVVRIVGLQLHQHAARAWIHRIRGRDQARLEVLAGILRHLEGRLQSWMELCGEGLRHLDVDRTVSMSETSNSSCPAPLPALIRAPMSVLRFVTTPSNGATMV